MFWFWIIVCICTGLICCGMSWPGFEPGTSRPWSGHSTICIILRLVEVINPKITPIPSQSRSIYIDESTRAFTNFRVGFKGCLDYMGGLHIAHDWVSPRICIKHQVIFLCTREIWVLLWENRLFAYAKTKMQISFAVTAKLISIFVFTTRIVQSLFYLNPKFQASNHLLWLYSPVCVRPGRKPRRPVFSQRGSYSSWYFPIILGSFPRINSLQSFIVILLSLWN